jgi:hypothetical protein
MTDEIDVEQWLAIRKEAGLQLEQMIRRGAPGGNWRYRLAERGGISASIDG